MTPQSRLDIMSLSADSIPCTPHPPGGDHRAWLPPRAHAKLITSLPHINSMEFMSLIQICAAAMTPTEDFCMLRAVLGIRTLAPTHL